MLEEIAAQMKVFVGLVGATVAAAIGIVVRKAYSDERFHWRRFWVDVFFAVLVAMIAAGLGEWLQLPLIIIYAFAGAGGYLGPLWLGEWLRDKSDIDPKESDDAPR